MMSFDGYWGHEFIQDLDEPGHLFVVGRVEAANAAIGWSASRQFGIAVLGGAASAPIAGVDPTQYCDAYAALPKTLFLERTSVSGST